MGQACGIPTVPRCVTALSRASRKLYLTPRKQHQVPKVLVLGLQGAGKTTILYQLQSKVIPPEAKFREVNKKIIQMGTSKAMFTEIDVPLYDEDQKWARHLTDCQGMIWVVDSYNLKKSGYAGELLTVAMDHIKDVPLLILANKSDRVTDPNIMSKVRGNLKLHDQLYQDRDHYVHACSAITGDGLEAGLAWLMSTIVEHERKKH